MNLPKNILIAVIYCVAYFMASTVNAQEEKKGHLGFLYGISIPTGDFASNDHLNMRAGAAEKNTFVDAHFQYKITGNYGLAIAIRNHKYSVNASTVLNSTTSILNDSFAVEDVNIDVTEWTMIGAMGGFYGTFPIMNSKIFHIDIRALIGFVRVASPQVVSNFTHNDTSYSVIQDAASASAFSYLLGTGFRIHLGKHFAFLLHADYLGTKPMFEIIEGRAVREDGAVINFRTFGFVQPIETFNLGAGIAILLN